MVSCKFIMKRSTGKRQGAGSSRSGGAQLGSVMDEEWGISSGSEYAPSETGSSTEGTVSMVNESCEAIRGSSSESDDAEEVHADNAEGSGKWKSRKRRREPIVEGRRWRRKATGDGFMFDKEGRGLRGVVLVSRELTAALVKAWVPQRKAFRLARRLMPFSVYDIALFTGLPVTETSDNLKSEKGRKRPVFRNYVKVMKKLLDANKEPEKLGLWLSLYAWRVMSGVMFPRTPYGATWSVQKYMEDVHRIGEYAWAEAVWRVRVEAIEEMQRKLEGPVFDMQMNGFSLLIQFLRLAGWDSVDHEGRYDAFQLVEEIKESEEEMLVPTVRAFMKTYGFRDYILDGEGVLSYEEHLEQAHEELRAEKEKHVDTLRMLEFWKSRANELEARLKMYATPGEAQDIRHQPGGDVREDMQSDSGLESLARAVTNLGEATAHEFSAVKSGEEDATCQTIADIPGACTGTRVDCWGIRCTGWAYVGEEVANTDAPGSGVDEVYVGGDSATGEDVCTTPASSAANVQDCTSAVIEGVEYEPMVDPEMESVHHGPPMTADSVAADHEACVQSRWVSPYRE
ncbi:hypothetical protein Cgig2_012550 [Carnegiea gigantea]|uniref:Aminotransferase-like plant mobile domain-containing protein n=1 Tax=Carnegiea gigantea TaxID=171969 RepID=A0A9Q1JP58_9CARY|nr:hypothetical protein Cgig2_012550 [Carnegiea gigantea]